MEGRDDGRAVSRHPQAKPGSGFLVSPKLIQDTPGCFRQSREIFGDDPPNHGGIHIVVKMPKDIPDRPDLRPGKLRHPCLRPLVQFAGGFRNALDATFDRVPFEMIGPKGCEVHTVDIGRRAFRVVDDVTKALEGALRRQ